MRVLLTGGAGFIGRWSDRALARAGHEVRVFDRAVDAGDDIVDLDRVRSRVAGCDAVVHLAAKVGLGVNLSDLDDYARTNDLGTAVVLRAAAEAGVGRVVYASSMVVYGEGAYTCARHGAVTPPPRVVEDLELGRFDPPCPRCGSPLVPGLVTEGSAVDPRNVYAATKVHGEHLAAVWVRETGGVVAALRFHNVYGPGMPRDTPYAGVASLFRAAIAAGRAPQVFEDGGQRRDFVHVRDVAEAVAAAVTAELHPGLTALNVGSDRVTTVGELAELLSRTLGGLPPEITGRFRLGDVRHVTADSGAARKLLGWRPQIDLERGLAEAL